MLSFDASIYAVRRLLDGLGRFGVEFAFYALTSNTRQKPAESSALRTKVSLPELLVRLAQLEANGRPCCIASSPCCIAAVSIFNEAS
eukprot:17560-Heterococcus_DN1.PRE.1